MVLSKEELEFIQEFEVKSKNRTQSILVDSLIYALIFVIIDLFDADFSFHFERIATLDILFTFISMFLLWMGIQFLFDYFKRRKYKKLILKRGV